MKLVRRNIGILTILLLLVGILIAADYDNIVPSNTETFVFSMNGCSGCEAMKPIVKELINENFNIGLVVGAGRLKEFNITTVPTTVVLVDGKEARRHVGTLSKEEIIAFINEN